MFDVQEIHQYCCKETGHYQKYKSKTMHTQSLQKMSHPRHFMNKCIRKLCNISSYLHFDDVVYSTVLQTAVYWPRGQQLHLIPPLYPRRGGRWIWIVCALELSTNAFRKFAKISQSRRRPQVGAFSVITNL